MVAVGGSCGSCACGERAMGTAEILQVFETTRIRDVVAFRALCNALKALVIKHVVELWRRGNKGRMTVLDLGCGDGAMLAHLQATRGCSGYGVEIDDANVLACVKRGVNVIQLNLDQGLRMFDDQSFDVVLQIDTLHAADGALRHGVLYDLLDRGEDHDIRSSTVERLAQGFGIDLQQATRVREVALQLFTQMRGRRDDANQIRAQRKLSWAATLHEIGARFSHAEYHKHGAYILDHVDASGFAVQEMHRLSLLVLGHRGKLRKLEADFDDRLLMQQLMALRLAVLLCHARRDPHLQGVSLALDEQHRLFRLQLPPDWAQRYPQSAHLLREECVAWQKTTWVLEVAA